MQVLLRAHDIAKSFGGVHALRGVSFDLRAGEIHALVGENGAGKSTLIKVLTGAHRADSGVLEIGGEAVSGHTPGSARALGVAAIYQQPALFPQLTVMENIALGLEPRRPLARVDWGQRRRRASALLERIGCRIDPGALAESLSMPQQQMVEIARALGADARVLILDEPTASLPSHEVQNLFRVLGELRERGVGMIYISHRLDELPALADRVTVLRDGSVVSTQAMAEVATDDLVRLMAGRSVSTAYPTRSASPGDVVLAARDLCSERAGVRLVNLELRAGEVVGLFGLVGAGRTELARVLFGLSPSDSGSILLRGQAVDIGDPRRAVALGLAYVPEDRRRHGVLLGMPVVENASLCVLERLSRLGLLDRERERAFGNEWMARLSIKAESMDALVGSLSGGNQQKVALARWLAVDPAVLIVDEPTQGIDVGARSEIYRLLSDLAAKGMAILIISSDLSEVIGLSDRVAVMRQGTVVATLDRAEATPERVLGLAIGGSAGSA